MTPRRLLRRRLDAMYGDELAGHVAYFVANSRTQKHHLASKHKAAK